VYPGDTVSSLSRVIGIKENANRQTGVVYVRSTGRKQTGEVVLDYTRWVMVRKRDPEAPAPAPVIPALPPSVPLSRMPPPEGLTMEGFDAGLAGSSYFWDDYEPGERIDHSDGQTIEEAEHQMATRLYQNTAR